jgi:hypothetical protein
MLAELLIMSAFEKRRLFAFAYENRVPLRAGKSLFKKKKDNKPKLSNEN